MANVPFINFKNLNAFGRDPLAFSEFMSEYYFLGRAHGYQDEHLIVRLSIYLKGQARDAYADIMSRANKPDTWANLRDELGQVLMPVDHQRLFR